MSQTSTFVEELESRQLMSVAVGATTIVPVAPAPAPAPAVIQPAQTWNWVGTFSVTSPTGVTTTGKISIGLVKNYAGSSYINVKINGAKFDGNMYSSPAAGKTYVNWFTFDKNWNQVPKGSLVGTIAPDGTFSGTMIKGKATGTFTMKRVA